MKVGLSSRFMTSLPVRMPLADDFTNLREEYQITIDKSLNKYEVAIYVNAVLKSTKN
jgi:hypothetical protein